MFSSNRLKQKTKTAVELTLTDGTVMRGNFFLSAQQRVLEAMNDERKSIPFEDSDDIVLNKWMSASIEPIDQVMEHAQPLPVNIGNVAWRRLPRSTSSTTVRPACTHENILGRFVFAGIRNKCLGLARRRGNSADECPRLLLA